MRSPRPFGVRSCSCALPLGSASRNAGQGHPLPSIDALDHPEVALHRAFEFSGRGLVGGTLISGERLFEARELDNDGAFTNAGVEGLDPAAACQERAAAGQDCRPCVLGVLRQRGGILDLPVTTSDFLTSWR